MPRARRGPLAALVLLAAVAPGAAAQYPSVPPPPPCTRARLARPRPAPLTAIGVVALQDLSTSNEDAYLPPALTRRLADRLRAAAVVPVVETRKFSPAQISTRDGLQSTARWLGARWLLTGSVSHEEGRVHLALQLVRVKDGAVVWRDARTTSFGGLTAVERDATREILAAAGLGAKRVREAPGWRDPSSGNAYEHFLRGSWLLSWDTAEGIRSALPQLESAARLDPAFAPASARLAAAYASLLYWGWWDYAEPRRVTLADRGLAAADAALRIDSASAEAWSARGALLSIRNPRTFAGVIASHRRAVAADPHNAEAHQWYGRALMQLGDDDAAAAQLQRALDIAPRRALVLYDLALLRRRARMRADACLLLDSAVVSEPTAAQPYALRALVRQSLGQRRFAWSDAETAARLGWPLWGEAASAVVDASARDTSAARDRARQLGRQTEAAGVEPEQWSGEYLAMAYIAAGDRERAIAALARAGTNGPALRFVLRDPLFAKLRAAPALRALGARTSSSDDAP